MKIKELSEETITKILLVCAVIPLILDLILYNGLKVIIPDIIIIVSLSLILTFVKIKIK